MTDSPEQPEKSDLGTREYLSIRNPGFSFHYTIDESLPAAFKHGILSKDEEEKRGLGVRPKASRSSHDQVYLTTEVQDLYFLKDENEDLDSALSDVVAIAIDTPDRIDQRGWFTEMGAVEPNRFKALVFVDCHINYGTKLSEKYVLGEPISQELAQERVKKLRSLCQKSGFDLPIYGITGNLYWPLRMTREEVRSSSLRLN